MANMHNYDHTQEHRMQQAIAALGTMGKPTILGGLLNFTSPGETVIHVSVYAAQMWYYRQVLNPSPYF